MFLRSTYLLIVFFILLFFQVGCGEKEQPKAEVGKDPRELLKSSPGVTHAPREKTSMTAKNLHAEKKGHQIEVIVPEEIAKSWKAVKLTIEDKKLNKKETHTVNLNSDFKIPDSDLTIKAGYFLPDFKMDSLSITSVSNKTKNPALNISIRNNEGEVFRGWLFSLHPTIHPFKHDRFSVVLAEGVKSE